MAADTVFCFLAALGVVWLGWLLLGGLLLPVRRTAVSVFLLTGAEPGLEQELRCWLWLHAAGLQKGQLFLLDAGASAEAGEVARRFADCYSFITYFSLSEME